MSHGGGSLSSPDCPGRLVAAVLAFKGQTAWDNKVFMSCSYSYKTQAKPFKGTLTIYIYSMHTLLHTCTGALSFPPTFSLPLSLQVNTESQMASGSVQDELVLKG